MAVGDRSRSCIVLVCLWLCVIGVKSLVINSYSLDNTALGITTTAYFNFTVETNVSTGGVLRVSLPSFTGNPVQLVGGGGVFDPSFVGGNSMGAGVVQIVTLQPLINGTWYALGLADVGSVSTAPGNPSLTTFNSTLATFGVALETNYTVAILPSGTTANTVIQGAVLGGVNTLEPPGETKVLGVRNLLTTPTQVLAGLRVNVSGAVIPGVVTVRVFNVFPNNGTLSALPYAFRVEPIVAANGFYVVNFAGPRPRMVLGSNTAVALYDPLNTLLSVAGCTSNCLASALHGGFSDYAGNMTAGYYVPNPQANALRIAIVRSSVSNVVFLGSFAASNCASFTPAFAAATTNYQCISAVGATTTSITFALTTASYGTPSLASPQTRALVFGVNQTFSLTLTSEAGTTRTYTILFYVRDNDNAIASLGVSSGLAFVAPTSYTPARKWHFLRATRDLTPGPAQTFNLTNVVVDAKATLLNSSTGPYTLTPGANTTVVLVVQAEDGTTSASTFQVLLPYSSVTTLASLNGTGSAGLNLQPAFSSANYGPYTLFVRRRTTRLALWPVSTFDPISTVTVNGSAPGTEFAIVDDPNEMQTLFIEVTSEEGSTAVYTVHVAMLPSDIFTLAGLSVGTGAALQPAFDPAVLDYTVNVTNGALNSLGLTAVLAEPVISTLDINGPVSGAVVNLAGVAVDVSQTVNLQVTAENGASQTYVLHVIRTVPESNLALATLTYDLADATLTPAFNPAVTHYILDAAIGTTQVRVFSSLASPRSSVQQVPVNNVTVGYVYPTSILLTVRAESAQTRVYNVTVFVAPPPSNDASNSTLIIAAAAGGAGGLLVLALCCVLSRKQYRRYRQRREIDALQSIELGDPEEPETDSSHKHKVVPPSMLVTTTASTWTDEPVVGPQSYRDRVTIS